MLTHSAAEIRIQYFATHDDCWLTKLVDSLDHIASIKNKRDCNNIKIKLVSLVSMYFV